MRAVEPVSIIENLGEVERCFYEVFREHGPAMRLSVLREECVHRGMNKNSFYQYVTYSPIVCRLAREVYSLVGAEVQPGIIEEAVNRNVRKAVIEGSGWTNDGRVWISYRLNLANLRSGVFSIPIGFKGIIGGQYFVQRSGTGAQNVILVEGERLSGLHRPISIRGGEQDDIVTVTFDLRRQAAEISFLEDDSELDGVAGISISSEPLSCFGSAGPEAAEASSSDGAPAAVQEWQPIATAPANRDLELRLADSIGHYALMFPCKLLPGQGWINTWLRKPLLADPVEWREWTEPPVVF